MAARIGCTTSINPLAGRFQYEHAVPVVRQAKQEPSVGLKAAEANPWRTRAGVGRRIRVGGASR